MKNQHGGDLPRTIPRAPLPLRGHDRMTTDTIVHRRPPKSAAYQRQASEPLHLGDGDGLGTRVRAKATDELDARDTAAPAVDSYQNHSAHRQGADTDIDP